MILPIYLYGHPVLKKVAEPIGMDYPALRELIENMWETMYQAKGVGLAAPQVGLSIRLFVVDTIQIREERKNGQEGIKKVFINPQILELNGEPWTYEEGCLSIPHINGDVDRPESVTIEYLDEQGDKHVETYTSLNARVIQHEYDHIEGLLFIEKLKPLKKRMIQRKLENIKKGNIEADYKIKYPKLTQGLK